MPSDGSTGRFTDNALFVLVARIVGLVAGVGTSIVIARVLGPTEQGRYALAMLVATTLVILGSLGIGPATTYHVARGRYSDAVVLGNTILLAVFVTLLSVGLGLAFVTTLHSRLLHDEPRLYVLAALGTIPSTFLISSFQAMFGGLQRFKDWMVISALQSVFALVAVFLTLVVLREGTAGLIVGVTLAYALTAFLAGLRLWLVVGIALAPSRAYFKDALAFGTRANVGNAVQFLNYRVDQILLFAMKGAEQVGIYSVAVNIGEQLWMVPDAAATAIFPRVASKGHEEARNAFTPVVTRNALVLALLGAVAMLVVSPFVVPLLWKPAYAPAVPALALLLPGVVAMAGAKVLAGDIAGRGRPIVTSLIAVLGLVLNVVLNLVAIPRWGIAGAAFVSTLTYAVILGGLLAAHCALSGNRPSQALIARKTDLALWRAAVTRLTARST